MQKSTLYLMATALASLFLFLMIGIHPLLDRNEIAKRIFAERQVVIRFGLTDICLFTEAPHTRHPNMADRFVPFQNHPSAAAHFPSESFLPPPRHLVQIRQPSSPGNKQ